MYVFVRSGTLWTQQAYIKASNPSVGDKFGASIALDGNRLAVGAAGESSIASGVNGLQDSDGLPRSGAVYLFTRSGTRWTQEAYVKASNPGIDDNFGISVGLEGNTLAVGASHEDESGAVYVFVRSAGAWTQQSYLKASNPDVDDEFGEKIALSGDTLAVGARREDGSATGVNGAQNNDSFSNGAVYVFVRGGGVWTQEAYIKGTDAQGAASFGESVALFGDTLAVGAPSDDSAATGINGSPESGEDLAFAFSGAVYVFVRSAAVWTQEAYIKASNTGQFDSFGTSVALVGDSLVVGAPGEKSNATGVNGTQTNNDLSFAGAAYVFARSGATWRQEAYIKASNTDERDGFGRSVALDAGTFVVGADSEASDASDGDGRRVSRDHPDRDTDDCGVGTRQLTHGFDLGRRASQGSVPIKVGIVL